jgi:hypothetical protein
MTMFFVSDLLIQLDTDQTENNSPNNTSVVTGCCLAMGRVLLTCSQAVASVKYYLLTVTKQQTDV